MMSGYKEMRLFATQFLGEIFDRYNSHQLKEWGIRVLIPQVLDSNLAIRPVPGCERDCASYPYQSNDD
jgi:hypothetical protein